MAVSGHCRRDIGLSLWASVVLLALLLPAAAGAGTVPSFASTAQYKAFIAYVKKLDGLVGQPTTAAQKAAYQAELTAKKEAAAHKANALFNRAGEEALAASNANRKEQVAAVRGIEAEELEALDAEYAAKLRKAGSSYHAKLERLAAGHRKFEKRVNEQIAALRAQKAQAADLARKEAIQERITRLIDELRAKRQEGSEKRAELKAGFRRQKEELHAAEAKKEAAIAAAAEAKVEQISKHWQKAFDEEQAKLDAKRDSQLAYLAAKLEKGRADIASMPAVG